ncbi:exo-beta-N-acetylmuramidase NamZ domain-containing protein [Psychroserpens sp.]|uniref:exo-beta-N-acetylmuramidase NamZ family protein n=1 Tax=Psychroserpens sp. TaxID=2020870 RepID=UPI00385D17DC
MFKNTVLLFVLLLISCGSKIKDESVSNLEINHQVQDKNSEKITPHIIVGANQTETYFPLLQGKRVGIVANQTSVVFNEKGYSHLVDSLLKFNIDIKKIFSPEHGFRGTADAGEHINDDYDVKTKLPIISLHGKTKKPTPEHLDGIDIMIFDIQDVGVRFYTYLSNLHYVMEASAENNIPLIVLDRPNPNGHYIDGPVLDTKYKSYVGLHPVPLVYGMTIGEYAQMINGEKWLRNEIQCDLTIISLKNYTHNTQYSLPIKPSPNLPNDQAINLYPSLDIFRGTPINVGRGTNYQMQRYGAPFFPKSDFSYIPKPNVGAKHPRFKGEVCYGIDLSNVPVLNRFTLKFVLDAYKKTPKNISFFGPTWTVHAGNEILQQQIEQGLSENEIKDSWKKDLDAFKELRKQYLIYD